MAERYSLKDDLFNADTVAHLGGLFADHLDPDAFSAAVLARFPELELMDRIQWIATVLAERLPPAFADKAEVIQTCLPPPLDPTRRDDDFGHFIYAPLGVIAEREGLDDLERSFALLEAVTQRFSMEFSIRAFYIAQPEETLTQAKRWVEHSHYHVRRLASEGARPKLPWGKSIPVTPDQTEPILDALHGDATRFVTRSVANHLNDWSKFDAPRVIASLRRWQTAGRQEDGELGWMTRHSLRSLVKAGDADALGLLGYRPDPRVALTHLGFAPDRLEIGETAVLEAEITAERDEPLVVDYVIDFVKANGSHAPKVFKWKTATVTPGQPLRLTKKHHFKAGATTFTHYPGPHKLRLVANGKVLGEVAFDLT